MPKDTATTTPSRSQEAIDKAGKDSFPASDPLPASPGPAVPPRAIRAKDLQQPDPELVEVTEHPISNPVTRSD